MALGTAPFSGHLTVDSLLDDARTATGPVPDRPAPARGTADPGPPGPPPDPAADPAPDTGREALRNGRPPGERDPRRHGPARGGPRGARRGTEPAGPPAPAAGGAPAPLTDAETRVAALAADGLPNRAIARELAVTPRTVEQHLTKAYRKLGIRGRPQLAAALGRTATEETT
ncbi:helix-turn-helix domain-containing protein [Streptomyces katrae]|uniref:helix-turn-helix domain-containing protein n=1 Tax=Streptomyces katrae TaxID=68223 RepID=UPI000B913448|nr:helix-turn-helix transcriptional regulator [Streptomyces katrae]